MATTSSDEMTEAEAEALLTADYTAEDVAREAPAAPVVDAADPDAPYGRYPSGRRRKTPLKRDATGPKAPAAKPAKKSASKAAPAGSYADRITESLKLPAAVLAIVGKARNSEALQCDAITVQLHGPSLGQSLGNLADKKPEVAAALDKILAAGPYGEILAAAAAFGLQIAANHNVMKPISSMGVLSKEDLVAAVTENG